MKNTFRLALKFDVQRLRKELHRLVSDVPFHPDCQQIALTHRSSSLDPFYDGVGSLYQDGLVAEESEFNLFNAKLTDWYMHEVYQTVRLQFPELGRVRLMNLRQKSCLSVHRDSGFRLHVPIVTNDQCFLIFQDSGIVHLPADGHAYLADTTIMHSAMNGHRDDHRTHMVFSLCNDQPAYFAQAQERWGG